MTKSVCEAGRYDDAFPWVCETHERHCASRALTWVAIVEIAVGARDRMKELQSQVIQRGFMLGILR